MEDGKTPVSSRSFPFSIYHFPFRPAFFSGLLRSGCWNLEARTSLEPPEPFWKFFQCDISAADARDHRPGAGAGPGERRRHGGRTGRLGDVLPGRLHAFHFELFDRHIVDGGDGGFGGVSQTEERSKRRRNGEDSLEGARPYPGGRRPSAGVLAGKNPQTQTALDLGLLVFGDSYLLYRAKRGPPAGNNWTFLLRSCLRFLRSSVVNPPFSHSRVGLRSTPCEFCEFGKQS